MESWKKEASPLLKTGLSILLPEQLIKQVERPSVGPQGTGSTRSERRRKVGKHREAKELP